jgi:PAS domain S-box-containing protein
MMGPDFSTGNFSKLFYLSAQPMWLFEPGSLRFLEVNEAATWEYGYKKSDFRAMTLLDIRPKEEHANLRQVVGKMAGDQLLEQPFHHLRRDGSLRTVQITSYEQRLEGGAAFLIVPGGITDERAPFLRFQQIIAKAELTLRIHSEWERKRYSEMRQLADLLVAGQPLSQQLSLVARLKELLYEEPGPGLN